MSDHTRVYWRLASEGKLKELKLHSQEHKSEIDFSYRNPDADYRTALMEATSQGHEAVAKWMLDNTSVSIYTKDKYECTVLHSACYNGHETIVLLLVRRGIRLNEQNKWGNTGLLDAAKQGHVSVVEILLDAGADTSIRDEENKSALDSAQERGHTAVVSVLKKHNEARPITGASTDSRERVSTKDGKVGLESGRQAKTDETIGSRRSPAQGLSSPLRGDGTPAANPSASGSKSVSMEQVLTRTVPLPKPTGNHEEIDDSLISAWMDFNQLAEEAAKEFDQFKVMIPKGTHFTQLVLIGTQSAGKSTLLEYLCRTRCSYAKSGLGTTRPIVYHVERDPKAKYQQIRLALDGPQVSSMELVEHLRLSQQDGKIRAEPIHVYMRSSEAFTITIVDLPGIIGLVEGASAEAQEHARRIENLALDYMKNPSTLIVAVRNGQDDWEVPNSRSAEKLIAKVDPNFCRTVVITTRTLGSPGLHDRSMEYFEGLGKEGHSFPNAPKFFVDAAIQKGSPAPIPFPTDPSEVPGVMVGVESSLADALSKNPQNTEIWDLLRYTLGFDNCTSYIRSLFVQASEKMLAEIRHGVQKSKQLIVKTIDKLQAQSPPEDFQERVQLLNTCVRLYCSIISTYMKENVGNSKGRSSYEEHTLINEALWNLSIEEVEKKGFEWYSLNVDKSLFSFKWTEEEMDSTERGEQHECGGAALNRLYGEARHGLEKYGNETNGSRRLPQFTSYMGVCNLSQGVSEDSAENDAPIKARNACKAVLRGIFMNIFDYFERRAYVILADVGKFFAFDVPHAHVEKYRDLPYFETAKRLLEHSKPIQDLMFGWFCQYVHSMREYYVIVRAHTLKSKLLQFNPDFKSYETSYEAELKQFESIKEVDKCKEKATVEYANKLIKEGFRKFFPDFAAMFQITFVQAFVQGDSGDMLVKLEKYLRDLSKDALAVNDMFLGNNETWAAINTLRSYKGKLEAIEAKLSKSA